MPDNDNDQILHDAFAALRRDALSVAPAQNIGGVRAIARRRHQVRVAALAAVVAVVLAVPVTAFALVGRTGHELPADPGPSVSTSPSPAPPASPSPSASAGLSQPPAPDGRIPFEQLGNATLSIPAWPATGLKCTSKPLKFTSGEADDPDGGPRTKIMKVVYADVDRDGADETVALLMCFYQGGDYQVAAFDRDAAGNIVTFGQVVTENATIKSMWDVAGAGNAVRVEVGDLQVCCGVDPDLSERQWRTYALDGDRFRQTGGPTQFHAKPKPNDLAVTTTALRLGPLVDGKRRGSITATVRNKGPAQAPGLVVTVVAESDELLPAEVEVTTSAAGCKRTPRTASHVGYLKCHFPPLAAGASRTYTFDFASPAANDPKISGTKFWSVAVDEEQPGIRQLDDPAREDNSANIPVTRDS